MNTTRFSRAVLVCALALGSLTAMAQQAPDGERAQKMLAELKQRFAAADANGDGRLTKDEAQAKMPMVYQHFDEIDTKHSGSVTLADIIAYLQAHHGERRDVPPGS